MLGKTSLMLGSAFCCIAVAAGAFGAHALRARLDGYSLGVWNTAAQYQMVHALALLVVGAISLSGGSTRTKCLKAAPWCFALGILIFSGSLYVLAISGIKWLGAITPIGGGLFLAGWICLFVWSWKLPSAGDA